METYDAATVGAAGATSLDAAAAERRQYRQASRALGIFLGVLILLALAIGWFVAGLAGVWGALIGVALAGLFCGGTMWSIARTIGAAPVSMAATLMLTWLAKLVVLIGVLSFLRGRDFYNPYILFAVIAVGVVGALVVQAFVLKRSRVPYIVTNTRTF